MKKIFALMMLAAAVAACTLPEDLTPDQPETLQTYTMTIKAAKGVDTKALTLSGNTLSASWKKGEAVTVKEGTSVLGTLSAQSDGPTTTLSGKLEERPTGNELTLEFNKEFDPLIQENYHAYTNQDGTIDYIAQSIDYATAKTSITINGSTITSSEPVVFSNQNAIAKFTLNDGNNPLIPSKLDVSITGSIPYKGHNITGIPFASFSFTPKGDDLYFALPTLSNLEAKYNMTVSDVKTSVSATVDGETYTYTKTGYPFEAGKYYDITVKMTKQYRTMDKATTNDIGKVIGADGKIYINADEASTAGTTAKAMIAYVGEVDGVCNHGLAISLTDVYEYQATLEQAQGDYIFPRWNSSHAVTGATWHLPTLEEWQYMLWSEVVTESTSIVSFQTLLSAVGVELADVDPDGVNFWTNTSGSSSGYQKVIYHRGDFASAQETNAEYCHVRGCLAF